MSISINNNNYTHPFQISQENFSQDSWTPLSSKFLEEIFHQTGNNTLTGISKVFNEILYRVNTGKSMRFAHETIATKVKFKSRFHAGRLLRQLEEYDIIRATRFYNGTSFYSVNPHILNEAMKRELSYLLPELSNAKIAKRKYYGDIMCINRSVAMFDKKMSHSLYSINIIENLSTLEMDDGAIFTSEDEPDWLVAAGMPCLPVQFLEKKDEEPENKWFDDHKQSISKKETLVMNENLYSKELVPVTSSLKSIKVTIWGQIRLCCYPDEAILYADEQMLNILSAGKKIDNPWKYFRGICETYCKERGLEVNWRPMIQLATQYAMPDEGPFIDASFIPVLVPVIKKKKTRTSVEPQRDPAKLWENEEKLKQNGIDAGLRQQQWQEAESEYVRINEPARHETRLKFALELQKMMGLTEDGTFKPGRTPEQARDILLGSLRS